MPDDFKPYSIDIYDKLRPGDFGTIFKAFKDKHNRRLDIMRFLAKEAKEERYAKERSQIADHIGVTVEDSLKHCNVLRDIGVICQIRSGRQDDRTKGPAELIKYYLAVENVIEILAILDAGALGLGKDGAKKIKKALTKIFNESEHKFRYGIHGGKFLDMQEQILDAIRNITHNYTQAQKDIINWWCTVAESNMGYYYYPWFYPASFANMASKAYRSVADYAISGLNITQNNIDAYIDMSKTCSGLVADNINELSEMAVNSSKMFEPIPQASMSTKWTGATPSYAEDDEYDMSAWKKLRDELIEIVRIALSSA